MVFGSVNLQKDSLRSTRRFATVLLAASLLLPHGIALAQQADAQGEQVPFGSLKLSGGKDPAKIQADNLEMRDKEGMAIFTGNVSVEQGQALLKSGKMVVFYNKQGGADSKPAGPAALSSAGIDHVELSGKVYLKSGTQVATGDSGTYDAKKQLMTLQGSQVVLTDGDNVATGCKLTAHMDTGKAFLESCKGQSKGRVSIILSPNSQKPGEAAPQTKPAQ